MSNEELDVFAGLAKELVESRNKGLEDEDNYFKCLETNRNLKKEIDGLLFELNRLRESEANALNAAEEAKRGRDDARAENAKLREALKPIIEFRVAPSKWLDKDEMYHKAFDAVRKAQAIMKGGAE